ncbi:hypothetical protein R3P38DRAFT_3173838 [Favolaschia claudopus]|uniref:Uncharacterized protein n=1 Tax=Favolaschia claudopus TaxID=2862362 RepID=A0AAW0DCQ4_9AGAR
MSWVGSFSWHSPRCFWPRRSSVSPLQRVLRDITNATPTLQAWISTLLGFKTFRRSTLDASRFHAIRKRKTRRDLENAGLPPSGNDSARDLQCLKSNLPCHELWSIARPRFGSFLRSELTLAGVLIFVGRSAAPRVRIFASRLDPARDLRAFEVEPAVS